MRITYEERRLRAIKLRYVFFAQRCECCKDQLSFEKMWSVDRWGPRETVERYYYCQNCIRTPKDVLNKIDTDDNQFGIAFVDEYKTPRPPIKTSSTAENIVKEKEKQQEKINKKKKKK